MKLLLCLLLLAVSPAIFSGCQSPPERRQAIQTQSLLATGQIAESAVGVAAQLFRDGKITASQARMVADLYDKDFQPAFRAAVAVSQNNMAAATPELISLASQLALVVAQYQKAP